MNKTSEVESVIEAYFEARAKKWEKYGLNWNSDDDREWLRQALTSFREKAVAEIAEDIIKMADRLESECNQHGDKGTKQWMAFKGFRNAIRDKYLPPKETN